MLAASFARAASEASRRAHDSSPVLFRNRYCYQPAVALASLVVGVGVKELVPPPHAQLYSALYYSSVFSLFTLLVRVNTCVGSLSVLYCQ